MPLRAVLLNEVKGNRITEWKKPAYFYLSTYDSWGGGGGKEDGQQLFTLRIQEPFTVFLFWNDSR